MTPDLQKGPRQARANDEVEGLLRAVRSQIGREAGGWGWLRSRPTWQRIGLVLFAAASLGVLVAVRLERPDLAAYPLRRLVLVEGLYALLFVLTVREVLRPPYSIVTQGSKRVIFWTGALLPFALAALPAALRVHAVDIGDHGHDCMLIGMAAGWLSILLLHAMDRDREDFAGRVWPMGIAGGLIANLVLGLHCPIDRPAHLLVIHATLGLFFALQYGLFVRLQRKRVG